MDWMAVSSYGSGTKSSGVVRILKDLDRDITGRARAGRRGHHRLRADPVLAAAEPRARAARPRSRCSRCCASPTRRRSPVAVRYVGFDIPNEFVVGYGLDYAERYRNLPFVGHARPARLRLVTSASQPRSAYASETPELTAGRPMRRRIRRRGLSGPVTDVRRYFRGPIFWIAVVVLAVLVGAQLLSTTGGYQQQGHLRGHRSRSRTATSSRPRTSAPTRPSSWRSRTATRSRPQYVEANGDYIADAAARQGRQVRRPDPAAERLA